MRLLVLFVFCLALVSAKWATPIEITSYVDPVRISKTMFTDASSGVTHIAYCNSSDGSLYHAFLDDSGLFLTGPKLINNALRCYHVEISGPHDGQHVYLTMEARRSMSIEECNVAHPEACDDLFVFESLDGGQTWQQPKNAGGKPGDALRRRTFKLLTNWRTPYMWMMYTQFEGMNMALAAVRYNTKTHAFEYEKVLVPKFTGLDNYQLITYDDTGKTNLILIYATPHTLSLQTLISTDEGVTWTKGAGLRNICAGEGFVTRTMVSRGKYLIAGCVKKEVTYFSFSTDLGKTWTEPQRFPSRDIEEVTFCNPEDPLGANPAILVMYREKKYLKVAYSGMPLGELKYADVPEAFYYAAYKMDLNCYVKANELKLRFMYHVRSPHVNGSKYTLHVIDNDDVAGKPKQPNPDL